MKLICNVSVANRLLPTLSVNSRPKHLKSTLALCKNPNSTEYCIILFNNQHKTGVKYGIKDNITKILTRFINDGKATIQFKMPPHDMYVQSEVIQLKGFLHLLKRILEDRISPKELSCSSMAVTQITNKDMPPKKLIIRNRSEYPTKGFPRTLEFLCINDIKRCSLDKGILLLTKLKVLDLSHNSIEFIPEELSNLNLKELNLSFNCLHKSTIKQWKWMGNQLSKTLNQLNLESNNLLFLSDQIIKLQNLITLNISNNQLKRLPNGLGNLKSLKFFNVSNNQLTSLPGSIRTCFFQSLNLSNNDFPLNRVRLNISPKNLPILTLKECSARRVLYLKLFYNSILIPQTLVNYLDDAKYCVCGKACFDVYLQSQDVLPISNLTQEFISSTNNAFLTLDCFYCSMKCFRTLQFGRNRRII